MLLWVTWAGPASALGHAAFVDPEVLGADPDVPVAAVAWRRGGLAAKAGALITLLGERAGDGLGLRLPGFIELHNHSGGPSFVPWEYWRGHLSLEGTYRRARGPHLWFASVLLSHESDHPTGAARPGRLGGAPFGYVYLNSVAARAGLGVVLGRQRLTGAVTARFHLVTCNVDPGTCPDGGGLVGSQTGEGSLELVHALPLGEPAPDGWRWVSAMHGTWLFPSGKVVRERRLALATGPAVRVEDRGLFSFRGELRVGSEVGYFRSQDALSLGVVLAWSP